MKFVISFTLSLSIDSPLLKYFSNKKNESNLSISSSWLSEIVLNRTLCNSPKVYENIATPKRRRNEQINRSESVIGYMSPKPTVDKLVNVK